MTKSAWARRGVAAIALCLSLFAINVRTASATHFLGGKLTWEKDFSFVSATQTKIIFTFEASWRSSFGWSPNPPFIGGGEIQPFYQIVVTTRGGISQTYDLRQQAVAVNNAEDWFTGRYTFAVIFNNATDFPVIATHENCCRSSVLLESNHDTSWRLTTVVDPTKGSRSPSSTALPRIYLEQGQAAAFQIPSSAYDGYINTFAFASVNDSLLLQARPMGISACTNGCAACVTPPYVGMCTQGMNLSQTGFVTWTPQTVGLYAVQFKITSVDAIGTAKTSSPLDVLIEVKPPCPTCPKPTVSVPAAVTVTAGHPVSIPVTVNETGNVPPGLIVSLANTPLPGGASITGFPNPPTFHYTASLNWTPTQAQVGDYQVCFQANDSNGLSSLSQACTVIHVVPNLPPGIGCTATLSVPALGPLGGPIDMNWGITDAEQDALTARTYLDNVLKETITIPASPGTNLQRSYLGSIGTHTLRIDVSDATSTASCSTAVTVEKLTPIVDFPPIAPLTYGQAPITLAASTNAGSLSPFFQVLSGPGQISAGNQLTSLGAGTIEVKVTFNGDAIYNTVTFVQLVFVGKATPVMTLTGGTFGYTGTPHAATMTLKGVNNVDVTPVFVTYDHSGVIPLGANTYEVEASFAGNANYEPVSATAQIVITAASLVATVSPSTRVYGAANPPFAVTYAGLQPGDTESLIAGAPVFATAAVANTPVGGVPVTVSGMSALNYDVVFQPGTLTITPASLTAKPNNASRGYGAPDPAFTADYSGFVAGDTAAAIVGTPTFATDAVANSPIGTYAINITGGLTSPNYAIAFAPGVLSVTQATLTIGVNNASKIYGGANPAFSLNYNGFVNGDMASTVTGTPVFSTVADASSPVGSYDVMVSGLSSTNYAVSFAKGTLVVTAAPLTIGVAPASRQYGGANPSFVPTFSGFVNTDSAASLGGAPAFSTPATATSGVGSYPVTPSGFTSSNYAIGYTDGSLTVTTAPLSIGVAPASRTYGATNPAFAPTFAGLVAGDTAASIAAGSFATAAVATSPVGSYAVTASGFSSPNYAISYTAGSLGITKTPLTVKANDVTRAFNTANPAFSATYTGFVNGETSSALGGTLVLSTTAVASSPAGSYPITAAGLTSANYAITFVPGTLTVTAETVTPGDMSGEGFVRDNDAKYFFTFHAVEKASGNDRARISIRVDEDGWKWFNKNHRDRDRHDRDDRFESRTVTSIVFSDDPTIRPGRKNKPQIDTVQFSGIGEWNGRGGYRYEAVAQDAGEPGRHRESISVTIRDSSNRIVAEFEGDLDGGNIRSVRIKH